MMISFLSPTRVLKRSRYDGGPNSCRVQCISNYGSYKSDLLGVTATATATATATIDDLPDPLLLDIFVRLEVKSAHQCKSVSKRWLTLISDSWFVRSFILHQFTFTRSSTLPFTFIPEFPRPYQKVELSVTHCSDAFGPQGFSLSFLPGYKFARRNAGSPVRVLGTSNDLLFCCVMNSPRFYYVCNPFTRQWVELPPSPHIGDEELLTGFVSHPYCKGLLEDHGNKLAARFTIDSQYIYRVVRATNRSKPGFLHLEIFISETGKWREWNVMYPLRFSLSSKLCTGGFLCNGRLHWMQAGMHGIIAYDPFNHLSAIIDIPAELKGVDGVHLGVCRGRLRLLSILNYERGLRVPCIVRVWELEDYSEDKWSKVHDVRMDSKVCLKFFDKLRSWLPANLSVAFHPYKADRVYMWFPLHFAWCNLRKGKFQMKMRSDQDKLYEPGYMVFSLVKPWFPTPVPALTTTHKF